MSGPAIGPDTLAGYVLEERLAVGGMAEIFRGRRLGPEGFEKPVAVKRMLPDLARDRELVRMFLDEARLAGRLSSPHIVQVFAFGEVDGAYYLVMELVEGADLATVIARHGALPAPLALHVGRELCEALVDLHGARGEDGQPLGIVHRDLSPANVLVSIEGHVKLADLGIAKVRARGGRTERGTLKGKLAYLSPEQARGDEVDPRTDLYGLGLVLYEALTGRRYLEGRSEAEMLRAAERPALRRASELVPALAPALDDALGRLLAPEPERRFPDAAAAARALAALVPPGEVASPRAALGELARRARGPEDGGRAEGRDGGRAGGGPPPSPGPATGERTAATAPGWSGAARADGGRSPGRRASTELLGPGAPSARRRGRGAWGLAALGLAGVALAGVALAVVAPRLAARSPGGGADPVALAVPAAVDGSAPARPGDAGATARDVGAPPPDVAPGPRDGAASPAADPDARRPPRAPTSPPVDATHGAAPEPDAGAARPGGERPAGPAPGPDGEPPLDPAAAARRAVLDRLGEVERVLGARGVLPADAPALFAARRALGDAARAGRPDAAAADELLARARAFAIDRAFIGAKLDRVNRRVSALPPAEQERLRAGTGRALSAIVEGRFEDANHELNAILSEIGR